MSAIVAFVDVFFVVVAVDVAAGLKELILFMCSLDKGSGAGDYYFHYDLAPSRILTSTGVIKGIIHALKQCILFTIKGKRNKFLL